MYKVYFFITTLFCSTLSFAQGVGVNTATPDSSTVLDVASANKGVSFPNVALVSETDAITVAAPKAGLMVYNTNTTMPCGKGLYFNNGTSTAPVWACFTKTVRNIHATGKGTKTVTDGFQITSQPGLLIVFTIPEGQTADIKIDAFIGALANSNGTGSYFDAVLTLDAAANLPNRGGQGRTTILPNAYATLSVTGYIAGLTAGSHFIELRTGRSGSYAGSTTFTVGGNSLYGEKNPGDMHLQIFYK